MATCLGAWGYAPTECHLMISADRTGDLNVEFPRNDSMALDLGLCIVSNGLLLCASVSLSVKAGVLGHGTQQEELVLGSHVSLHVLFLSFICFYI